MAIHKLSLDDIFYDEYQWILIKTSMEDYQLCFMLNQALETKLERTIDIPYPEDETVGFSGFQWVDDLTNEFWKIIANKVDITKKDLSPNALFDSVFRFYLSEIDADYIIKIENLHQSKNIEDIIKSILKIQEINHASVFNPQDKNLAYLTSL